MVEQVQRVRVNQGCPKCNNPMRVEHDGFGLTAVCVSGCVRVYDSVAGPELYREYEHSTVNSDAQRKRRSEAATLEQVAEHPDRRWSTVKFDVNAWAWWKPQNEGELLCDSEPPLGICIFGHVLCHIAPKRANTTTGPVIVDELTINYSLEEIGQRGRLALRRGFRKAIEQKTGRLVRFFGEDNVIWPIDAPLLPRTVDGE